MKPANSDSHQVCSRRSFALRITLVMITLLAAAGNALAAPKPKITSPTTASGMLTVAFSYQILADQAIPSGGYAATPMPPGLSFAATTGLISGTPTAVGTFTINLSVTNSNGTGTATLTLTVTGPPNGLFVGLRLPDFLRVAGSPNNPRLMLQMGATQGTTPHQFNVTLEVDAGGGTWVPYNRFVGIDDSTSWITDAPLAVRDSGALTGAPPAFSTAQLTFNGLPQVYMKADPRATRFGIFQMDTNPTGNSRIIDSVWPLNSSTALPNGYGGAVGTVVEHVPLRFAGSNYFPATFSINNGQSNSIRNTVTTNYADNDGVVRPADATYPDPSLSITGSSTPYNTSDYRPIILNRPFQNVAELGYVFRDLPWKTLDLFSGNSADAGLLDVFSTNDSPAVVAGNINLNSRQTAGLQSILAGANWDLTPTIVNNTGAPTAQIAPTMATNIATATSATLMKNKTELITRAGLPTTILPLPGTSQANQTVKTRREVVPRAITSVSQTRVWNLVIDVVAQSGRYAPGETNLTKFNVEGQQHYWVHVAIDRFTGQVIDKQIEVVNE